MAAAAFPAVAFAGLSAKAGSNAFENLPSDLKVPPPTQNSYVYANDGKTLIATIYEENRKYVPLTDIAPVMQKAVVAAEDTRFYEHHGVDMRGVLRSLVANNSSGEVSQGASTLTMQYVRNVLKDDPNLTPQQRTEATEESAARKLREMRYAIALEKKWNKAQILEHYLNIAYFGHQAYGIYAASEAYFSKPASALTLDEATMLAGLIQSPDQYDPANPASIKYAQSRRKYVLDSMTKLGDIKPADAKTAAATPIQLKPTVVPSGCAGVPSAHNDWGFFCDYFTQWWDNNKAFGNSVTERENKLKRGGYRIVTSLDPTVQAEAYQQSTSVYSVNNKLALPIAVVQPGTGRVLALAVNRKYSLDPNPSGQNNYPNTVNPLITGGQGFTGYQTGSTYKMFTMLAALDQGKPLNTGFNAPVQFTTHYPVGAGPASCGGYYCVKNDQDTSYFSGQRNMWSGFGHSVNTYFVWLEQEVGPQNAVKMAENLGIHFEGDPNKENTDAWLANNADQWGAFTLGVSATFPLELANAYATVANDGKRCEPLPVQSITDSNGNAVSAANPSCQQVIKPEVARGATDAARCPVGSDSAFPGQCDHQGTAESVAGIMHNRPVAGKTGTSENESTESFAGFTPQVAAAGTAVDPVDPSDNVGSGVGPSVTAAVAHTMWSAVQNQPSKNFTAPTSTTAFGSGGQPPPSNKGNGTKATPSGNDNPPVDGGQPTTGTGGGGVLPCPPFCRRGGGPHR